MNFFSLRVGLFLLIPILYVIGRAFVSAGVPQTTVDLASVVIFAAVAIASVRRYMYGR